MASEMLKPEDPITAGELMEVAEEAMILAGIPQPRGPHEYPRAIAVFPGLGEWWRIAHAVDMLRCADPQWTTQWLISGYNRKEETYVRLTRKALGDHPHLPQFKVIMKEGVTEDYTPQQAEWLVEKLVEEQVRTVGLIVSPYHMLRAYLTLLKALLWVRQEVVVVPLMPRISPLWKVPETGELMLNRHQPEIVRIVKYRRKGDVASHREFVEAIRNLWCDLSRRYIRYEGYDFELGGDFAIAAIKHQASHGVQ